MSAEPEPGGHLVRRPGEDAVAEAAAALGAGGVVGVPTDTVYGLAALAASPEGCARLFELKLRPGRVALPVLVGDPAAALELADARAHPALEALGAAFWPGPLTIVVRSARPLGQLGGDGRSVGLRCPGEPVVAALCRLAGPLAVTSANEHGSAPCTDAAQVAAAFPCGLWGVLDGGRREGTPSTVVSLLGEAPAVLRPGPIEREAVSRALVSSRHREVPK